MSETITDANDMVLRIGSEKAGGNTGQLIVDDFDFSVTSNNESQYGVGNDKPQGRTNGNKEAELSFTLLGENASTFREVSNDDSTFNATLRGRDTSWRVRQLDYDDFSFSGSDGSDPVEFAATLTPMDWDLD